MKEFRDGGSAHEKHTPRNFLLCHMARPQWAPGADIGRYGAHRGAPCPPLQPSGPMGPLGPPPVPLEPWGGVQAPAPRPIRQWPGLWLGLVELVYGQPTTLEASVVGPNAPWGHWGHWGGMGGLWVVGVPPGPSMGEKTLQWVILGQNLS